MKESNSPPKAFIAGVQNFAAGSSRFGHRPSETNALSLYDRWCDAALRSNLEERVLIVSLAAHGTNVDPLDRLFVTAANLGFTGMNEPAVDGWLRALQMSGGRGERRLMMTAQTQLAMLKKTTDLPAIAIEAEKHGWFRECIRARIDNASLCVSAKRFAAARQYATRAVQFAMEQGFDDLEVEGRIIEARAGEGRSVDEAVNAFRLLAGAQEKAHQKGYRHLELLAFLVRIELQERFGETSASVFIPRESLIAAARNMMPPDVQADAGWCAFASASIFGSDDNNQQSVGISEMDALTSRERAVALRVIAGINNPEIA